jgi:hypothetical protein
MPAQEITGTVTQKSNGTITIKPSDGGAFAKSPAMGDEVAVTIEVTKTVAEIEKEAAEHKAAAKKAPEPVAPKKK